MISAFTSVVPAVAIAPAATSKFHRQRAKRRRVRRSAKASAESPPASSVSPYQRRMSAAGHLANSKRRLSLQMHLVHDDDSYTGTQKLPRSRRVSCARKSRSRPRASALGRLRAAERQR
eukprot:CAMPEP_0118890308 /NCGR_PEP_ID=MMETSP1166-20130328/834_2 /TAXON_ID=1104430 /ORGANISM="Chrysoreinhardia sp, Strain CCMP3193" /LENGTH=118 /DNA_ID=CAMNT_0006828919 /DNA_START=425 /DNA_END=777 /DNA_ORIENTATION=-